MPPAKIPIGCLAGSVGSQAVKIGTAGSALVGSTQSTLPTSAIPFGATIEEVT